MKSFIIIALLFLYGCSEKARSPASLGIPEVEEHSYYISVTPKNGVIKEFFPPNDSSYEIEIGRDGRVACIFSPEELKNGKYSRLLSCAVVRNKRDPGILRMLVNCDYNSNVVAFIIEVPRMGLDHVIGASCRFGK